MELQQRAKPLVIHAGYPLRLLTRYARTGEEGAPVLAMDAQSKAKIEKG
jgi:hypothetical protein